MASNRTQKKYNWMPIKPLRSGPGEPSQGALYERLRLCYRKRISKFLFPSYRRSRCSHLPVFPSPFNRQSYEFVLLFLRILHVWAHYKNNNAITFPLGGSTKKKIYAHKNILLFRRGKIFLSFFLSHTARDKTSHRTCAKYNFTKKSHRQWKKWKKFLKSTGRRTEETRPERRKAAHWRREKSLTAHRFAVVESLLEDKKIRLEM